MIPKQILIPLIAFTALVAIVAAVVIAVYIKPSCVEPLRNEFVSGSSRDKHPIERVIPGVLNTFLFTYYASEYRATVDDMEFCCETPVIEHVLWTHGIPVMQQGRQTIQCTLVIQLPKGRQTRGGQTQTFRDVSIHVPVEIDLFNKDTIHVVQLHHVNTILYIGIEEPISQKSLVQMFDNMFFTFNRLAPFDTRITVE